MSYIPDHFLFYFIAQIWLELAILLSQPPSVPGLHTYFTTLSYLIIVFLLFLG